MHAKRRSWTSTLALGLIALAAVFVVTEDASAQAKGASKGDRASANKKGMDVLADKKFDQNKLPGTREYIIAFGSLAGAVAAIKYL